MKGTAVLALSFLLPLLAFLTNLPLAFSDVEQVVDVNGNPIFPGFTYYILPAIRGPPGGGLKLGQTGNSQCALTVLQDYIEVFRGIPVKFTIPGVSPGIIFTGTHQYLINLIISDFKVNKNGNFSIYMQQDHESPQIFYIIYLLMNSEISYQTVLKVYFSLTIMSH